MARFPGCDLQFGLRGLPARSVFVFVLGIAALSVSRSAVSETVSWTFRGSIDYSDNPSFVSAQRVSGTLTFDTNAPGQYYNAGLSAQYWNAVSALSITIPDANTSYSISGGAAHYQVQDRASGLYEVAIYGNNWTGTQFQAVGSAPNVTGVELFLRSFTDFLAPYRTALPTTPYDLSLVPATQSGLGASFEFYPNGGYVRGQLAELAMAVPEAGASVLFLVGAPLVWVVALRRRARVAIVR